MNFIKKEKEYTAFGNYQKFTKSDIKAGDILIFRNHEAGIAFPDANCVLYDHYEKVSGFSDIKEDLTDKFTSDWDITQVRRPDTFEHLMKGGWKDAPIIWNREEVIEMTMEEVCKALGKNVKIVKE